MNRNGFEGPVKRSVRIAGHPTSVSLESVFWDALQEAAGREGVAINALVARIDAERVRAAKPVNLASAIRIWLFERARDLASCPRAPGDE